MFARDTVLGAGDRINKTGCARSSGSSQIITGQCGEKSYKDKGYFDVRC